MISSRSVCRTDHQKSEHFRKIGASGSPAVVRGSAEAVQLAPAPFLDQINKVSTRLEKGRK